MMYPASDDSMVEDVVEMFGFNLDHESISKNKISAKRQIISAVYFLWRGQEIVYVGCTKTHPMDRISVHRRRFDFDEVSWIEVPVDLLRPVEWFYIDRYKPEINRNYYRPHLGLEIESMTGIPMKTLNGRG